MSLLPVISLDALRVNHRAHFKVEHGELLQTEPLMRCEMIPDECHLSVMSLLQFIFTVQANI